MVHARTAVSLGIPPENIFIMNNTFWVGTFPALGEEEISRISDAIHDFVKSRIYVNAG